MYNFVMDNLDKPQIILAEYKRNKRTWDQLKKEYPDWKRRLTPYLQKHPELKQLLKDEGIAI
jgi:hypothetical protein